MIFDQFTTKYNGKFIDFDGKWGFQCVDEIRQYLKEVLGLDGYTLPPVTYAKQLFTNFPNTGTKDFFKVFNSPTNAPPKGAIVIWGTYPFVTGIAGHVALCSASTSMSLITFDQNYGNPKSCHFVQHSYKGVLGWLTPKKSVV